MQILRDINEWRQIRESIPSQLSVGLVTTMGNLHKGHASLFRKCQEDNDITVGTIFVNPTQFNQSSDYTLYPRTEEADLALLESIGVDYCLLPSEKDIYPQGYIYQIRSQQNENMESNYRPGHFDGVLTVLMKIFNLIKPHRVYFGEKDYHQLQLVKGMVKDFFMPIEVNECPTIREGSNLPFSSRNNRLNPDQRHLADTFAKIFHQKEKDCAEISAELTQAKISVDYVIDSDNRRFAAVYIDEIRLIDNYNL